MNIFITGGAGFIGTNLSERLIKAGFKVTIYDNLSRLGSGCNISWLQAKHGSSSFNFIESDVRDFASLNRSLIRSSPDYVIHLAGQTAVTNSISDPRRNFEDNVLGTFNVYESCRLAKNEGLDPLIILSSTNKVYGDLSQLETVELATRYELKDLPSGVSESFPTNGLTPYGCSKLICENLATDYLHSFGVKSAILRKSCIYGPRQLGSESQGWLDWFIKQANSQQPLKIFGNGKQVRDILHVSDLVRLYELILQNGDKAKGQVFNVGGGLKNSVSVWYDFKELVERATGRRLCASFLPPRPYDQKVYISNIDKAQKLLGWEPRMDLTDGISTLVYSSLQTMAPLQQL